MDPLTHTMAGAGLSGAGLRRATPLATATLILAANAPDIDSITRIAGTYPHLALHRGVTHGIPGLLLLPFAILGLILLWDRHVRLRRHPEAAPVRPGPTLALGYVGVTSHLFLDWLNTYGIRWLVPLDGRWFHADAVFIIDPWIWLILATPLVLAHSSRRWAQVAWGVLGAAATGLVLAVDVVPNAARVAWLAGLATLVALRLRAPEPPGERRAERRFRGALLLFAAYVTVMIVSTRAAADEVRTALAERGIREVQDVMAAPNPANPFERTVVARAPGVYHMGEHSWLRRPRVEIGVDSIPNPEPTPTERAALETPNARHFLAWSRFPFRRIEERDDGYTVYIVDARYIDRGGRGALAGVVVRLNEALEPMPADGNGMAQGEGR